MGRLSSRGKALSWGHFCAEGSPRSHLGTDIKLSRQLKQSQLGIHPPPRHPARGLSLRSEALPLANGSSPWSHRTRPCPTPAYSGASLRLASCSMPRVTSREQDRAQILPSSDRGLSGQSWRLESCLGLSRCSSSFLVCNQPYRPLASWG